MTGDGCPDASGMLLTLVGFSVMGTLIDTDDLIDAQGIADLLGLAQRNTVSLYQRRYPEMPKPVIDLGQGRCKLWLRSEIEDWRQNREDRDTR
jgi:glutathione-regulated potassium-efflux system ancillary protein KefG